MDDKIIKLAMPGHDKVLVELKQRYEKVRLKKCFVVCWYGPWPVYFQVYLNSCSYNKGWNWIIFTDTDITNYNVPDNVEVVYRTLVELKDLFEKKLSIRFGKLKPYKLCDFKPSYGLIFEEYLKSYDYWGFCDIDLIWGNLNSIFPDGIISKYDKFLTKGHMTLFKNSEKNKYLFQKEICRYVDYRIILSSKYNWGFDETGRFSIDKIIDKEPFYRCYRDMALIADISPYHDGMYIENNGEMKKIQYAVFNGGGGICEA